MREAQACTADGHTIGLTRSGAKHGPVVVITHGTFSGPLSCGRLAQYLGAQGFGVWLFGWRGHGLNRPTGPDYDFETLASHDIDAAITEIRRQEPGQPLHLIVHSGAGIAAAVWAARNPQLANEALGALVLLSVQATHAAATPLAWATVRGYLAWIGRKEWVEAGRMVGPELESARLMRQWCQWNLQRSFLGHDGMDYLRALQQVHVPVLALAGAGDRLIAPWQGCEALFRAFGGTDTEFMLCGKATGFKEDYTHGRLLMSGNAHAEVYPRIAQWLRLRALGCDGAAAREHPPQRQPSAAAT